MTEPRRFETVRWGVVGTGNIARQFARGLAELPDARLVGVGSRSPDTAQAFAKEFSVARAHGSYEALAADPDIDAVYVATPHTLHAENTLTCLLEGKAVLCEKPFALNAAEARSMVSAARDSGLFLMEAMWTRFFPLFGTFLDLVRDGRIGEPKLLQADFGFASGATSGRLVDPALGGGALLDLGVYPVSLASAVLGEPERVSSQAHLGPTGVDEEVGIVSKHPGGAMALLSATIRANTPQEALVVGTRGSVRLHSPWWMPQKLTVTNADGNTSELGAPLPHNGYAYEAAEVMRCLREGALESPIMPLSETLSVMGTLDTCRRQWGLVYPGERR